MGSKLLLLLHGPVCPKPEIEAKIMPGFTPWRTSQPRSRRSIVPAEKFSTTTSAFFTISMNISLPLGSFRFRVTPFLQRSTNMK
ncbi:hypothetical protein ES703_19863 [subsurface metagenome]